MMEALKLSVDVRCDLEAQMHMALLHLKAAWNATSAIEQILDSELWQTDEVEAAKANLDAAMERLALNTPAAMLYQLTAVNLFREMQAPEDQDPAAARYERALRAIARCKLMGANFGDYVQAVCEDVLEGGEAECPECGTGAHDGPCVSEVVS